MYKNFPDQAFQEVARFTVDTHPETAGVEDFKKKLQANHEASQACFSEDVSEKRIQLVLDRIALLDSPEGHKWVDDTDEHLAVLRGVAKDMQDYLKNERRENDERRELSAE